MLLYGFQRILPNENNGLFSSAISLEIGFLANQTQTNLSNSWWEKIEKAWVCQCTLCFSGQKIAILSVNRNQTQVLGWLLILHYSHNILQIFHLKVDFFYKKCFNILLYKYMIKRPLSKFVKLKFLFQKNKSYNV